MGQHYNEEFKQRVIDDYKEGKHGGRDRLAKFYNIPSSTIMKWIAKDRRQGNQKNDIEHKRGRSKEGNIDYKERYEILKNYQAFIKAQREKK